MPTNRNVGVLVSGRGSNFRSLLDAKARGDLDANFTVVISNNPSAGAKAHAEEFGIPWVVIDHRTFASRQAFEEELVAQLRAHDVSVVVLAGFMRVLSSTFLDAYGGLTLNIHPSLLPAFPGLNAQKQAIEAGVRVSGCTVHLVDSGVDTGPIIDQAVVAVPNDDTVEALSARILVQEHRLLPRALGWVLDGRVTIQDQVVALDA
ncbi:MAG: phosphoribosylglycinamide formyltransferase [Myxococcales bacterium]|nr:phosphoribosylglycinamide formyltransferase [Myxococcales bacterium]